jgi:hypothetical protein
VSLHKPLFFPVSGIPITAADVGAKGLSALWLWLAAVVVVVP